jgi:hypothetical protein
MMNKYFFLAAWLAVFSVGTANAYTISGWSFSWGSIQGDVEVRGVGDKNPAILAADITLTNVSYFCENPTEKLVAPGEAGTKDLAVNVLIDADSITSKNGKVVVSFTADVGAEYSQSELDAGCNNLWTALPETLGVDAFTIDLEVAACEDFDCTTTSEKKNKSDTLTLQCFADGGLVRDPLTLEPEKDQAFFCSEAFIN